MVPRKSSPYDGMGRSRCGIGTLKRVPVTMYSVFSVTNGDAWLPAEFGICTISVVRKVVRSTRATRGVLLALPKIQRPSGTPSVMERTTWCRSSQGM